MRSALALLFAVLAAAPVLAVGGEPVLRVGILPDVAEVVVGAPGQDLLLTASGEPVGDRARVGPIRFGTREAIVAEPAGKPTFSVRVRSESTKKKADLVRGALAATLQAPLRVEKTGSGWAVVAGPFDDEGRARSVVDELQAAGMTEARVQRAEAPESGDGSRLVAVTGLWKVLDIPGENARVVALDGPILVDGKPHRGEIEVALNAAGQLVVVAHVGLEDYVRGVVPEEMGPEVFPAPEALAAQAIAARTYALGPPAHSKDGFDVCATAHCQVYGGSGSEHPLSDAAVRATTSKVLAWNGKLARAFFSSTCGGRTEAVENVFEGGPLPYLAGVACYPEQVAFTRLSGVLLPADWQRVDGSSAHDVLARLRAVGVLSPDEAAEGLFSRRARAEEARTWLERAARAAGRSIDAPALANLRADTALAFVRDAGRALGLAEQGRLLDEQDLQAAARFRDMQGLEGEDLRTALLATKAGLLPDGLEPGWAEMKLSRGNVLEFLERYLRAQGALDGKTVRFVSARDGVLQVLDGKSVVPLAIAPRTPLLSRRRDGRPRLRESLELKLGDKLRLLTDAAGHVTAVELEEDPDGAAFDRTSSYSWWTRRITLEQLRKQAETRGIQGVRDASVTRVSAAGRVVGLELVDGRGQSRLVERFAVRELLQIPDSRADLHFERDDAHRLTAITATGRGWGHGVGLCQVGAFGMALAGRTHQQILAHYYPGTRLLPVFEVDR